MLFDLIKTRLERLSRIPAALQAFFGAAGEPRYMKAPGDLSIGYGRDQPLQQLAFVLLVNSAVLLLSNRLALNRHYPPARLTDLLLLGIGTHKLSRLVAKDRVTAPLRAPFTQFEKSAGSGEVEEHARGTGWQTVIGELMRMGGNRFDCALAYEPAASAAGVWLVSHYHRFPFSAPNL